MTTITDPIALFAEWYALALAADRALLPEANAMFLATTGADGAPSARMVLLKGYDESGFVFYTNLDSRKARELAANPRAALGFYWAAIDLQIRVEGKASPVTEAEADEYFASRPPAKQIAAWASMQSQVVEPPGELDRRVARYEQEFAGAAIHRPPFWSGFRVRPKRMEFWKNRPNRLHSRTLYTRVGEGWRVDTLYP